VERCVIILTKLQRPGVAEDFVVRPRLVARLEAGRSRKLTLISAPAGYGKSSLASAWLESTGYASVWYAIDETDDDLHRFLGYLITGLRQHAPDCCLQAHALLQAVKLPPVSVIAASLVNDLAEIDDPPLLVFDDYHLIEGSDSARLISALMQHLPRQVHMVIITRQDPDLALITLRARHEMLELRGADLRFTEGEAAAFLAGALGGRLTAEIERLLIEKTEGWAVGLRLAALSMRGSEDATQFAERLGAAHGGLVLEYLISEALTHTTPAMKDFLLKTSVLDQFSPELCAAVLDDAEPLVDVEDRIDELVRANLFVISIDGEHRWWRYHHLFQDLLQHELRRQLSAEEISGLHSRASAWFAQDGLIDEALHHALAAGDVAGAAKLVEKNRHAILNADQWYVLEKWLSMLPDGIKRQRPELLLAQAWVAYFAFNLRTIPPILESVELLLGNDAIDAVTEEGVKGEVDFFWGLHWFWYGQTSRSLELFQRALTWIPSSYQQGRGETGVFWALAGQMTGQRETVVQTLTNWLYYEQTPQSTRMTRLLAALLFVYILAGELSEAGRVTQQLAYVATESGNIYAQIWSSYLHGYAHYFRNSLEEAAFYFEEAVKGRYILHTKAAVDSLAGLALTYQALGKADKAAATVDILLEFVRETNDPTYVTTARSCQARVALVRGDQKPALDWMRIDDSSTDAGIMFYWLEIPRITQCRALIAQGTPASLQEAEKKLRQYEQENQALHNTRQLIEILPLLALARLKQGREQEALATLEQAVTLAAVDGWMRPFLELEPGIVGLLNELGQRGVASVFIARIVDALPFFRSGVTGANQSRLPEPLTDRELDVLALMARRYRDKEIATELFISPATVRRHASNIYQKLQVNGRRQAVGKAIALGVLPSSM